MRNRIITALLAVALLGFAALGIANITKTHNKLKTKDIQLQSKQSDLQLLEIKFNKLNIDLQKEQGNKTQDQKKIEELQKAKDLLQKQLEDAERDLQAKAVKQEAEKQKLAQAARITPTVHAESTNFYKNFIYQHESGNNPASVNSIGCRGLGQACPGTKLPCGADYACQDAWFTNYMQQRYGSWANAYTFWVNNHWW